MDPINNSNHTVIPILNLDETQNVPKKTNLLASTNRITRKDKTYIIKNTCTFNEDAEEDDRFKMINDLYDDTISMTRMANIKAYVFKLLFVLGTFFITISGAVIGVLGVNYGTDQNADKSPATIYVITVLGFSITIVKTLLALFKVEQRSYQIKEIAVKLRKIARDVRMVKALNLSHIELFQKLNEFYSDIDDLDVHLFGDFTDKNYNVNVSKTNDV